MKRGFIIAAIILIVAGVALFIGAFAAAGFDFSRIGDSALTVKTYSPAGEFDGIEIDAKEADIVFKSSEDGKLSVECKERENDGYSVEVKNGVLKIENADERHWYDRFFSFGSPSITVYLPGDKYGSLVIKGGTGDVKVPEAIAFASADIDLSTGDVEWNASVDGTLKIAVSTGDVTIGEVSVKEIALSVSTGDAIISGAECERLTTEGSTGDVTLIKTVVSESIRIKRSTGDVVFDRADAGEIEIKTSTGDVTGTLLSDKIFTTKTSTGSVRLPESGSGGKCRIETSTGDIRLSIAK